MRAELVMKVDDFFEREAERVVRALGGGGAGPLPAELELLDAVRRTGWAGASTLPYAHSVRVNTGARLAPRDREELNGRVQE